ncbi:MAG: hypothetical protein IPJ34_12600 [Myxococcales bacterium]|nr:hypothetical protein [Myxococcales bacterium]
MRSWSRSGTGASSRSTRAVGKARSGENEGNVVYSLFLPSGAAVLRGFHRDSPMNPFLHRKPRRWPGLVDGMPASLLRHADATSIEPDEVAFVIWYDPATASGWQRGRQRLPNGADPDGSEALLAPFVGAADRYLDFARSYHDRVLPRGPVVRLLRGAAVDAATVHRLNPARDAKEVLREARALGFETKGPTMTTKESKKPAEKSAQEGCEGQACSA